MYCAYGMRYKFDGLDESWLTPHTLTFLDKQECEGIAYNYDRIIKLFDEALSLQWPERDSSSRQRLQSSSRLFCAQAQRFHGQCLISVRCDTGNPRVYFFGPVPAPVNTVPVWGKGTVSPMNFTGYP